MVAVKQAYLILKEAIHMVQFLAGLKGEGKTRKLIDMANENANVTDGSLVFIDDDTRHIHSLHRDIRLVETGKHLLDSYREFVGYILGILSQNSDIKHIYVDALTNIMADGAVNGDSLVKLKHKLDAIADSAQVDFTISVHYEKASLPDEIK